MTKTIITSYTTFLCLALVMAGSMTVEASQVTGTLSSDAGSSKSEVTGTLSSGIAQTDGSLVGTVTSDTGGSSSGGSSSGGSSTRGSGGGGSASSPSGSVLGASTSNAQTPSFPNAGFAPTEVTTRVTVWSTVVSFLRSIVSL